MTAKIALIIDNRNVEGETFSGIDHAAGFLDLIRQKRRLFEEIHDITKGYEIHIVSNDNDSDAIIKLLETDATGRLYLYWPSFLMPMDMAEVAPLLAKLTYSDKELLIAQSHDSNAVLLVKKALMLLLLRESEPVSRKNMSRSIQEDLVAIVDHCKFMSLKDSRNFLQFMAGATETRHFNNVQIEGSILRKQSSDKQKMRSESDYFHQIPDRMKRFFLPTFDYWEQHDLAGYSMEYMAVPDVSNLVIHRGISLTGIEHLFEKIFSFISTRQVSDAIDSLPIEDTWNVQIVKKLEDRMQQFLSTGAGESIQRILAQTGDGDLSSLLQRLTSILSKFAEQNNKLKPCHSHGDLCFSNILYDERIGLLRFIDPKGATSPAQTLMHPYYDIAKLSHSVFGLYDFVNHGLFDCVYEPDLKLRHVIKLPHSNAIGQSKYEDYITSIQHIFERHLKEHGFDINMVRAVEASLFLSMLPLHVDYPRKCLAFACIGRSIIEELENAQN